MIQMKCYQTDVQEQRLMQPCDWSLGSTNSPHISPPQKWRLSGTPSQGSALSPDSNTLGHRPSNI